MFLRRNRNTIDTVSYDYWSLCESYRTARGPRQRVVATLGKLSDEELAPRSSAGWDDFATLLSGKGHGSRSIAPKREQMMLGDKPTPKQPPPSPTPLPALQADPPRWEVADLANLRTERVREFGAPWLALSLWHRLELPQLLASIIPPGKEHIPWADIAAVLTAARFCGQLSELHICEHWYDLTALEDLTGIPKSKVNDDRLYRALHVLGKHKDALCQHLMKRYPSKFKRYHDMFGVRFEFLLYDVTSTFFEGQANRNPQAARGYSRDQRSDCKQVCIGLVCTPEGLPLSFEIFNGNRTDVTTVPEIVRSMEEKYGQSERVWVMDRGMVSESNIDFLRARKARYLIGTPKKQLKEFEQNLLDTNGWHDVQAGLEAKLIPHPDGKGEEQYVMCRSTARSDKERAMLSRQMDALTTELAKIDKALQKRPEPDIEKVSRRIGRWLGKYPAGAKVLEAKLLRNEAGQATSLQLTSNVKQGQALLKSCGSYLLRTNCQETDPAQIWRWYIQLTQAEAAFRTAKSDLHLRPIYHQKADRVAAHILVCFLALAQWRVLEQWMTSVGLGTCAKRLIEAISTIRSLDVIVPVKRGPATAELTIRTVSRPERRVSELLSRLGLVLPTRNKILGEEALPSQRQKAIVPAAATEQQQESNRSENGAPAPAPLAEHRSPTEAVE